MNMIGNTAKKEENRLDDSNNKLHDMDFTVSKKFVKEMDENCRKFLGEGLFKDDNIVSKEVANDFKDMVIGKDAKDIQNDSMMQATKLNQRRQEIINNLTDISKKIIDSKNNLNKDELAEITIDVDYIRQESQNIMKDYYEKELKNYVNKDKIENLSDKIKLFNCEEIIAEYNKRYPNFKGTQVPPGFFDYRNNQCCIQYPTETNYPMSYDPISAIHRVLHELNHSLAYNRYIKKDNVYVRQQGVYDYRIKTNKLKYTSKVLKHGINSKKLQNANYLLKNKIKTKKLRNMQLDEAINEYLVRDMMGNMYPEYDPCAYKENRKLIEMMEDGFGKETIKKAFYNNNPKLLKNKFEETFVKAYSMSSKKEIGGKSKKNLADVRWNDFIKALEDSNNSKKSKKDRNKASKKALWYATVFSCTRKNWDRATEFNTELKNKLEGLNNDKKM